MSKAPTQDELNKGMLTDDTLSIHKTFRIHGCLLLLLLKLEVIPDQYYYILCRDFQANTFNKIRDGE